MDTKTDTILLENLKIIVTTPEAILFDGTAKSITSTNTNGIFDVLPLHENFISIIQKEVIVQVTNKEKKTFPLDMGVMEVTENQIHVYLGMQALVS